MVSTETVILVIYIIGAVLTYISLKIKGDPEPIPAALLWVVFVFIWIFQDKDGKLGG